MHHDGLIKGRTTGIKGDRGPHDMGLCPLFVHDVDASWPSIGVHRIGRSAIFADFFYKAVSFLSL